MAKPCINVATLALNHNGLPLLIFGLGVLCGAASFGGRYISQFLYIIA